MAEPTTPPSHNIDNRPNFIFIFADDIGMGDLRSYGHPYAVTDHLDRMAQQGTSFFQFHNTGNICPHSRAGFMTSRNPSWFPNYTDDYGFLGTLTVTQLLHDAGYKVGHIGKWNIGPEPAGRTEFLEYGIDHLRLTPDSGPSDARGREGRRFDAAMQFVEQSKDTAFYLNLWVRTPHTPVNPPPALLNVFEGLVVDKTQFGPEMRNKLTRFESQGIDINVLMQKYLAEIYGLDVQIGRLLNQLEQLNLTERTIVVFTSDNGPALDQPGSSGNLRGGKHVWYQGGVVTPFLIQWPGSIPAGKLNDRSIFSALDWLPTICSLAGIKVPWDIVEGEDVSDIWLGEERSRSNPLFFRDPRLRSRLAMRYNQWKLLQWRNAGQSSSRYELYNLEMDPRERVDLYDAHPEIVLAMIDTLRQWEETMPDIHIRLPNEPSPFNASTPAQVVDPPRFMIDGQSIVPSETPSDFPSNAPSSLGTITSRPSDGPSPSTLPLPVSSTRFPSRIPSPQPSPFPGEVALLPSTQTPTASDIDDDSTPFPTDAFGNSPRFPVSTLVDEISTTPSTFPSGKETSPTRMPVASDSPTFLPSISTRVIGNDIPNNIPSLLPTVSSYDNSQLPPPSTHATNEPVSDMNGLESTGSSSIGRSGENSIGRICSVLMVLLYV